MTKRSCIVQICFLLCLIGYTDGQSVYIPPEQISFDHMGRKDGLVDNTTYAMIHDSKGFIWIGSYGGLDRYDGYGVRGLRNIPGLDEDVWGVMTLLETEVDGHLRIWIGTMTRGLVCFDPVTETAVRYKYSSDSSGTISSNWIKCLYQDSRERLWIGTANGVSVLDLRNYPEKTIFQTFLAKDSSGAYAILDIDEDSQNTIWLTSYGRGLIRYRPDANSQDTGTFSYYTRQESGKNSLSSNLLTSLHIFKNDAILISTINGGLNLFHPGQNRFYRYLHNSGDPNSVCSNNLSGLSVTENEEIWISSTGDGLSRVINPDLIYKKPSVKTPDLKFINYNAGNSNISSNYIWDIDIDRTGSLWVMTSGNGINILNPYKNRFGLITHRFGAHNSLGNNYVNCQYEDADALLWIGTMGMLDCYDRRTKEFRHFKSITGDPYSLPANHSVECIMPDPDNPDILWLGLSGYGVGLCKFNKKTGIFTAYPNDITDRVYAMAPGNDGLFWIGLGSSKGIVRFDPISGKWLDRNLGGKLPEQEIHQILNGRNGSLWLVPDGNGFYRYDPDSEVLTHYLSHDDPDSNYWNTVNNIHQDVDSKIWIASVRGLSRLDPATDRTERYFTDDSINMYGILEDDHNNLWISCDIGLTVFNKLNGEKRFYSEIDGLQESVFNINPWRSLINGDFVFGGYGGINIFHPDSIRINTEQPSLAITDFQLFNKSIRSGNDKYSVLKKSILHTDQINLNYDQNSFNFEFAALDIRTPGKNKYAYKLAGIDSGWVYCDSRKRFASYTRVSPGEYTFYLNGTNSDGLWSGNPLAVRIMISPPWWQTIWAYMIYFVTFGGLFALAWKQQLRRINLKHQLQLEHLESEKYKEINVSKSRFFANISHEFRTPITVIEATLGEVFTGKLRREYQGKLEIMLRNSARLLNLVNRLLDLSRLEAGKTPLRASKGDIVALIRLLTQSFESMAKNRNITLEIESGSEIVELYFDQEKIEEIVNNLLGNAFKYTPDGGKIAIKCSQNESRESFILICTNSGPGIEPDKLKRIFDRFYQADEIGYKDHQGVGIGLALVQELVKLHKGNINAESVPNQFTRFIIELPLGRDHLNDTELAPAHSEHGSGSKIFLNLLNESDTLKIYGKETPTLPGNKILIVEDNIDMRGHLVNIFDPDYNVIEATNGLHGLESAIKYMPDLIISDVMMPQMDGITMCTSLKTNPDTCHIPILLLTARAEDMDKLSGLENGADDYITKPFSARELQMRVNNIFAQKERIRKRILTEFDIHPADIVVSPINEKFLSQMNSLINQHMNEKDMSIQSLAGELNISRATLARKIHSMLGMNPVEYLRFMRLKRAHTLLKKGFGNVTEVSFEVGFNSVSYFSRCFTEQFGQSPSQLSR